MRRTYWIDFPRDFANEFTVAIATNASQGAIYKRLGFTRIPRERALRELVSRGDAATSIYAAAEIDGNSVDRFETARDLVSA